MSASDVRKGSAHVVFRQTHGKIPVEGAVVTVDLDREGRVVRVQTLARDAVRVESLTPALAAPVAERVAARERGLAVLPSRRRPTELVILPTDRGDRLVWKVRFATDDPVGDWVYYVDARTGEVLSARNDTWFLSGAVAAKVLLVDGSGTPQLKAVANQYVTVGAERATTGADGTYATAAGGTVSAALEGPWTKVVNEDCAGATHSGAASWTWDYPTSDTHFDEVNTFYHINLMHDHFKGTHGVTGMDYQIRATVHKGEKFANAYYSPTDNGLFFGDGDDLNTRNAAKAAEVIYHEYGHATHDHVYSPMFESGIFSMQIRSMGEAWADYFAGVLTGDDKFGEWWILVPGQVRYLVNNMKYPDDMEGEEHADGPIYAGALWDYRLAVGGAVADRTVVASWYYRPTDFRGGLIAMLQADDELFGDMNLANGSPHQPQIEQAFSKHGISTSIAEALQPVVAARNVTVKGVPTRQLQLMASNGTGARPIPGTYTWDWPEWHEGARMVAANGYDALGNIAVFAMDPLLEMKVQVTGNLEPTGKVQALYPSLSPTGDYVAYSWGYQGQVTMNLAFAPVAAVDPAKPMGTDVPNVDSMDAGANQYFPDWSKANGRIVYAQMYGPLLDKTKRGLWSVGADGTGLTQVTRPQWGFTPTTWVEDDFYPCWSRAGDKIAFVRVTGVIPTFGNPYYLYRLRIVRADGSDEPGVLVLDGSTAFPVTQQAIAGLGLGDLSWSPAGDALMFGVCTAVDGLGSPTGYNLYRIKTDGSGLTQVTTGGNTATSDWGDLDTSPPVVAGVSIDAAPTRPDLLTFSVNAVDPQSGVHNLQYAIGTTPGGTDARLWTTVSGAKSRFTASRLALINGRTYYVTVKAKNGVGLVGNAVSSAGILVDVPAVSLSIAASKSLVPYNGSVVLSGRLAIPSGPLAGRGVTLWRSSNGGASWSFDGTATYETASQTYRATRQIQRKTAFRLRFAGDDGYVGAASGLVSVNSAAYLPRPSVPARVRRNRYFIVSGSLRPRHAGKTPLYFYRKVGRRWRFYRMVRVANRNVSGGSSYRLRYRLPLAGLWYVKAYHYDGDHARTWSGQRGFRVL